MSSAIIVMGVCASGKSTFGAQLAERINAAFIDGDDLHPSENVSKMASGQPLTDADRAPWLEAIRQSIVEHTGAGDSVVIACSCLKRTYRDALREGTDLQFAFLDVSRASIEQRIARRSGHFMKSGMVASQFSILERPLDEPDVVTLDGEQAVDTLLDNYLDSLD